MRLMEHLNGFTLSCRQNFYKQRKDPFPHLQTVEDENGEKVVKWVKQSTGKKRGKITKFSSRSAARLRHLLMRLERPVGSYTFAITCTIPGMHRIDDWRPLIERFRTNLSRCKVGMIWRVELQRRGTPHLHCVAVCDTMDKVGDIWNAWVKACDCVYEGLVPTEQGYLSMPWSCHAGFLVYGFSCKLVTNTRWFAYVAGHATKSKQSQLGFAGRQWGIFNKRYLSFTSTVETDAEEGFLIFLCRCIRKRFRFSRVDTRSCHGCYDFFIDPSFVRSARDWYYRDFIPSDFC